MSNSAQIPYENLPDVKSLIRHEYIRSMPQFPEGQKEKYIIGVAELWKKIEGRNPDTDEYRSAHRKLFEVTQSIKGHIQRTQAHAATQQNGVRPASAAQPGQSVQQDGRPPALSTQGGAQPQPAEAFSQRIIEEVKKLNIVAPTNLAGNETAVKQWIRDAQRKYADSLQKLDTAGKKLSQFHQVANTRTQQGKPLDSRETENYQAQVARWEHVQSESKQAIQGFKAQQEVYRGQQPQNQAIPGGNPALGFSQAPITSAPGQKPNMSGTASSQIKQEPQGQPHTVSSAVDAARNQANPAARSNMSPHSNGQPTQASLNQPSNLRTQPNNNQASHSHPSLNINTSSGLPNQQHSSPRVAPTQLSAIHNEPVALSHSAAVDAARSYSQPNIAQQTPQSTTHGPSSDQRNQTNHAKMPIPKDLNLPPVTPVSVGPSRPTLTNGPIAMGSIGQPAIQKHPGYVLEGEGERVLSKKKLEDLVRQVTGGTGGDGEEGEGLTAEVEETLLQVADEFVDNVIVAACRLAKLRQSSTLELRDLQLILERNYNIRVPGYASDELRTVKKIVPTQAWTQKLSAVQAAKVTGGKGD